MISLSTSQLHLSAPQFQGAAKKSLKIEGSLTPQNVQFIQKQFKQHPQLTEITIQQDKTFILKIEKKKGKYDISISDYVDVPKQKHTYYVPYYIGILDCAIDKASGQASGTLSKSDSSDRRQTEFLTKWGGRQKSPIVAVNTIIDTAAVAQLKLTNAHYTI